MVQRVKQAATSFRGMDRCFRTQLGFCGEGIQRLARPHPIVTVGGLVRVTGIGGCDWETFEFGLLLQERCKYLCMHCATIMPLAGRFAGGFLTRDGGFPPIAVE